MQFFIKLLHEAGSWRDRIVFEVFLTVSNACIPIELFDVLLVLLGTSEPARPLVVHFAAGSHSIKSHYDHFGWFEHVHDIVDVVKDFDPHLLKFLGHELRFEDDRVVLARRRSTLTQR